MTSNCKVRQPLRFETDFSFPIINSLLDANNLTLRKYTDNCWHSLITNRKSPTFTLHVCGWHAERFIKKKIEDCYAGLQQPMKEIVLKNMHSWMLAFLRGRNLDSMVNRITQAVVLTGTPMRSAKITETVNILHIRSPDCGMFF